MQDYLSFGSTPADEECAQVGKPDYHARMRKEARAYINQLLRQSPPPEGSSGRITNKSFPHDFGSYHEVCAVFDDNDKVAVKWAYDLDNNLPKNWDDEALNELGAFRCTMCDEVRTGRSTVVGNTRLCEDCR